MKIKTLSQFLSIEVGDEVTHGGDSYIVTDVGTHFDEAYIEISDVESGDGITTDNKPIEGTEYRMLFSEAKNKLETI